MGVMRFHVHIFVSTSRMSLDSPPLSILPLSNKSSVAVFEKSIHLFFLPSILSPSLFLLFLIKMLKKKESMFGVS